MGCIVLAGGRSGRMGGDKALLPYEGGRMLDYVVSRAAEAATPVVVVAARVGQYEHVVGATVVGDLYPGCGPLGGLITGLAALGSGRHAAVGCDMPAVHPALLRRLVELTEGYGAAVPEIDGRLEPLCAAYDAGCRERLVAELTRGRRALHQAVRTLHLRIVTRAEVEAHDPRLDSLMNLNTPEEYDRALAVARTDLAPNRNA